VKISLSSDIGDVYVWPFCPSVPMLEALEWFTDARTSHSGLDARARYRNKPRRTYEVRAVLPHPDYTRAANILFDGASYPWAMPIWPERTVGVNVSAGAGSLTVDTATASYGDLAIIWQSPTAWEVVDIATVGSGTLTLSGTVQASYTDARIMPLRLGRIQQVPTMDASKPIGTVRFLWQSDENVRYDPEAPDQYEGNDLYFECPLLDGDGVQDGLPGAHRRDGRTHWDRRHQGTVDREPAHPAAQGVRQGSRNLLGLPAVAAPSRRKDARVLDADVLTRHPHHHHGRARHAVPDP